MARKQTIDAILGLFKKLGGNTNDVIGTKTNVNFLGKGKSPELMLDMDINAEALGVLPRSKAVEELTSSVGYAVSGKLNDIQANQLLKNMQTMDSVYFPPAAPANITDMVTGTRNLDQEGLMSLRKGGFDDIDPNSEIAASLRLEEKGKKLADSINNWTVEPIGTEGYRTAEVTLGGVDTNELSSKTMMSKKYPGLFFVGEVVDVTGHLGGYNFQWAWSSGYVAGQYA